MPAGSDPAQGRPQCNGAGQQCGGACDGTNVRACTYPGLGVSCRQADCQNGIATLVAFCDGAGTCPPPEQQNCPVDSACFGTLCAGGPNSCTTDGACNSDQHCSGGVCVSKKDAGVPCNTAAECKSSVCIDGVCCTTACTGQCEACNVAPNEGTCSPVNGAPRGSRQACGGDGTICDGSCDGVTPDRCAYKGAQTSCRPGTCTNGLANLAATCQGNGSCGPLQQQSCDTVGCDSAGAQCDGPCASGTACASGEFCSAGICVAKLPDGGTCGASSQCTNGHCVDGLCCDTACVDQCESCDQAGSLGKCIAITGAPRDGRPACPGSGACGGFCDGASRTTCALPGATVTCGVGFCASGSATGTPKCGGNASCNVPVAASCDPFQCEAAGLSCLTSCQLDTECAPGLLCIDGDCTQPAPDDGGIIGGPDASGAAGSGAGGATGPDASVGAGGATATGGAAGSVGTGGRAGGTGGRSATVDGGAAAAAGDDAGTKDSGANGGLAKGEDRGSCGCRVPGARTSGSGSALALLACMSLLVAGRRRRDRAA